MISHVASDIYSRQVFLRADDFLRSKTLFSAFCYRVYFELRFKEDLVLCILDLYTVSAGKYVRVREFSFDYAC